MLNKIVNVVYPRRCALCDEALDAKEQGICAVCKKKTVFIKPPMCFRCGRPVDKYDEYCVECAKEKHFFESGRIALSYRQVGESIYRFKYMNRTEYASFYAETMAHCMSQWLEVVKPDGLIPVPLHKNRQKKRGYNQSELLARELSKRIQVPVFNDVILRKKDTIPQKKCDKNQRIINMKKAFIVGENVVKLEKVVIIDDIFTTGSTIDSMAKELKAAGVKKIYFATISAANT